MREADFQPIRWWQVLIGGCIVVPACVWGLLWAFVILGWVLEGGA